MNLKTFIEGRKANREAQEQHNNAPRKTRKRKAPPKTAVAKEPTGDGSKA